MALAAIICLLGLIDPDPSQIPRIIARADKVTTGKRIYDVFEKSENSMLYDQEIVYIEALFQHALKQDAVAAAQIQQGAGT